MPGLPVWLSADARAVGDDGVVAFEDDDGLPAARSLKRARLRRGTRDGVVAVPGLVPVRRANSPGWGVRIRGPAAWASKSGRSARANRASASTTIGCLISR